MVVGVANLGASNRTALTAREIRTLRKPFDPDRLCDLVHETLARP
jgi:hypothetical protein